MNISFQNDGQKWTWLLVNGLKFGYYQESSVVLGHTYARAMRCDEGKEFDSESAAQQWLTEQIEKSDRPSDSSK